MKLLIEDRVELLGESLHVPQLKFSLISISSFDQLGFRTVIKDSNIRIYDTCERLYIEEYLNNNVYYLKMNTL